MSGMLRERKKAPSVPVHAQGFTAQDVKSQLSAAAGTEAFEHRDPIYHLNESFRRTFDIMGQQRARGTQPNPDAMLRVYMQEQNPGLEDQSKDEGSSVSVREDVPGITGFSEALEHKTDMSGNYEPRDPRQRLMSRFSDISFQRGRLSAAIVRGTGKMMLFSCLERTVGQQESKQRRERMLFQRSSSHRLIPQRREDISISNEGFADSAVGLVVDVLKDARQVLDSFTAMAEGKSGSAGMGTLHKQFPFLTDTPERELLEQYRTRLEQLKGPGHQEEREVLKRAEEKAEAIIHKKDQMKRDFLQCLRQLSYNALSAQALFTSEEFLSQAVRRMNQEDELSPPDDGDDQGSGSGADDAENGKGEEA